MNAELDVTSREWQDFWEEADGRPTEYDYRADSQLPVGAAGVVAVRQVVVV